MINIKYIKLEGLSPWKASLRRIPITTKFQYFGPKIF